MVAGDLWASVGFRLMFQWVTQLYSAAVREGTLRVEAQSMLDLVAFWFFPIVLDSVALVLASAFRRHTFRGRTRWREPDPDPASTVVSTPSGP